MKSLFKDTHTYDDRKLKNILSHYCKSNAVVFPVVNDGYVVNNVIEYLSKTSNFLPSIVLLDKNWFILNLYNSIIYFKDELISSLQFIEKAYNESSDKFSMYDLFVTFLYSKECANTKDANYIERHYKDKLNIPISMLETESFLTNISWDKRVKYICSEAYLDYSFDLRHSKQECDYVKQLKKSNKIFIDAKSGKDLYTLYSFDEYDKHFISSLSPYEHLRGVVVYLAVTYLTQHNNDIFDLIGKWTLGKPNLKSCFNNEKLDFTEVYNTINELHNIMSLFKFSMYVIDIKSLFIKYKRLSNSNDLNDTTFMYINCYDEFGNYDYEFANIVVPRLTANNPNVFLY